MNHSPNHHSNHSPPHGSDPTPGPSHSPGSPHGHARGAPHSHSHAHTHSGASSSSKGGVLRSAAIQGALCGGLAAMSASTCTHPLDVLKVRMQLSGELDGRVKHSVIKTAKNMWHNEGIIGFYRGLPVSLLRQSIYSTSRFGMYHFLLSSYTHFVSRGAPEQQHHTMAASPVSASPPPGWFKFFASMGSGAFGGFLSTPVDMLMIRIQADGRLTDSAKRGYTNIWSGLTRIFKEEGGVNGLLRGATPNIQRAILVTCTQFTFYDAFKSFYLSSFPYFHADSVLTHVCAAGSAGFCVASIASPVDVVRTRMMNSKQQAAHAPHPSRGNTHAPPAAHTHAHASAHAHSPGSAIPAANTSTPAPSSTGKVTHAYAYAYRSTWECITQTARTEGIRGFYKGFLPYYARVGPQVLLMFVFLEQYTQLWNKHLR